MIPRILSRPRFKYGRPVLFVLGPSIYYSFRDKALLSDGKPEWPDTGEIVVQTSRKIRHRNLKRIGWSPLEAKDGEGNSNDASPTDSPGTAWAIFVAKLAAAGDSVTSLEWSSVKNSIVEYVAPDWAMLLPAFVTKLQGELEWAPGSLAAEIWQEADDPSIHPEILWNARVRIGKDLCPEEKAFQERRKLFVRHALARYLNLPFEDIHPDDIPTIALCGSGGGLRALVAGTGSCLGAQEAGLYDCVTYTAGVSGSCWLQTLYNTSVSGQNFARLVDHLKNRIGIHIAFPPAFLELLTSAPTNKFLLSGLLEKARGDLDATFGIVDIYGLLLGARLLVPKGELGVNNRDLKISNQRGHIENGAHPMPIYAAVRHEIPLEASSTQGNGEGRPSDATKEKAKQEAYFQWFEFTPWELWCEELDAGIPMWSLGRQFDNGVNVPRDNGLALPEIRIPQLMGIWGSAFCATLSHYYKEVRPVMKGLAGFAGIDGIMEGRDSDLVKVHPIAPASIPNFVLGLQSKLPPTAPESIFSSSHIQLMDAGMSNNLPIYPLLRPGRAVDILIAFDASADIKTENWLSVADGYAKQRGIKGWPLGLGWPRSNTPPARISDELEAAQASTAQEAATKVAEARDQQRDDSNQTQAAAVPGSTFDPNSSDLGYCTVWVGTTEERSSTDEPPPSKRVSPDDGGWELMTPDAGIAVVYFPLLPNPRVPGVDPDMTDFLSTWNFVYTPEQIDRVVALARANFDEGSAQTKRCVRAVYERKRKARLEREDRERRRWWRRRVKDGGDVFR